MVIQEDIVFSWSGGKDSAFSLYEVKRAGAYCVRRLFTTLTEGYDRISMHGVRRALLEEQARFLGLPLDTLYIPKNGTNQDYESRLADLLEKYKQTGIHSVGFGDLFLEDIRAYREKNLASIGMRAVFPVWKKDTAALARDFISDGFKAIIVCVDPKTLDPSFTGRLFDADFLRDLPPSVDPCGENGEFHSFVFDGPIFSEAVRFAVGEIVSRDGFYFCDLLPIKLETPSPSNRLKS